MRDLSTLFLATATLALVITSGCAVKEEGEVVQREEQVLGSDRDEPSTQGTSVDAGGEYAEEYRQAADIVRQHYTAISRDSYHRAYDLWSEGAREFNEFTAEAEKIDRAVVTFDRAGRVGMMDDHLVAEVPVTVEITLTGGAELQRHEIFLIGQEPGGLWKIMESRIE